MSNVPGLCVSCSKRITFDQKTHSWSIQQPPHDEECPDGKLCSRPEASKIRGFGIIDHQHSVPTQNKTIEWIGKTKARCDGSEIPIPAVGRCTTRVLLAKVREAGVFHCCAPFIVRALIDFDSVADAPVAPPAPNPLSSVK